MLGEWPYYNLVTPVVVAVGAGVVAYTWRLVARLSAAEDRAKPPARSPTLRRMGLVLLCFLVVATVFWSTATIAQWTGRGLARSTARHLDDLPTVILDTKERLFLLDPGVKETALVPTTEGQTFHYRYRNLHLLIQGKNRMFLVPPAWSASDTVLVVPLDDSVRVRFQFRTTRPDPVSAGADDVWRTQPGRVRGGVVALVLRFPLGGHPGAIVRNLALQRSFVPAERESHEAGYGFGALHAAIPRLDRYPGSARQDVFQMPGPLMGDRVQRLDPQIVISAG